LARIFKRTGQITKRRKSALENQKFCRKQKIKKKQIAMLAGPILSNPQITKWRKSALENQKF